MKISTRGRYGLRAILDIAAHSNEGCVSLKSIASRHKLSENYLEQLMSSLKKADLVKSIRGPQGGYIINVDPRSVTVLDVLRVLEGDTLSSICVGDTSVTCGTSCDDCITRPVWERLYESLNDVLNSITLSELLDEGSDHLEKGLVK